MSLIGMERLKRRLSRIPETVKKRAQSDLVLAGREINMRQRALVPKKDGILASTIRTEPLVDGTVGVSITAGGSATTKRVRKSEKGNSPTYDYALAQEFGTKNMPPNAFFWPGYRIEKKKAMRRVRAGVRRAMREAAKNG